MNNKANITL